MVDPMIALKEEIEIRRRGGIVWEGDKHGFTWFGYYRNKITFVIYKTGHFYTGYKVHRESVSVILDKDWKLETLQKLAEKWLYENLDQLEG